MERKIFLATFSDDALKVIKKYDIGIEFNQFCISQTLDEDKIDRTIAAMQKEMKECGISDERGAIVHGPFTELCPQSIDPLFVDLAMKRFEQAYEGCRRLGLKRLVVHSGFIPLIYFPVWHVKQSVKFWSRFMEDKPEDFTIYIENVLDSEPESLTEIVSQIDDPRVKLCLDVGHANVVTEPEYSVTDWIRIMGPRLGYFHLHNNDGSSDQHRPLTSGSLNMKEILAAIDDYCDPSATLTIESRECDESVVWLLKQ